MTEYETMTYERKGKIGYIMFNRPRSLNAMNDQLEKDLAAAYLEFDADEEAWVAILHGTGRCFCAGADIKQNFAGRTPEQAAAQARAGARRPTWAGPSTGSRSSPRSTATPWAAAPPSPPHAT